MNTVRCAPTFAIQTLAFPNYWLVFATTSLLVCIATTATGVSYVLISFFTCFVHTEVIGDCTSSLCFQNLYNVV